MLGSACAATPAAPYRARRVSGAESLPWRFAPPPIHGAAAPAPGPGPAPLPPSCQATRMNALLAEMRRGMEELQLGLDGALNMSDAMEALARGIAANAVPDAWMAAMSTRIQEVGRAGALGPGPGPEAARPRKPAGRPGGLAPERLPSQTHPRLLPAPL
jgi:hypothetical protein